MPEMSSPRSFREVQIEVQKEQRAAAVDPETRGGERRCIVENIPPEFPASPSRRAEAEDTGGREPRRAARPDLDPARRQEAMYQPRYPVRRTAEGRQQPRGLAPKRKRSTQRSRRASRAETRALDVLKSKLRAAAYTPHGVDLARLFRDVDRSQPTVHQGLGSLTLAGFAAAVRHRGGSSSSSLTEEELDALFDAADKDGSGRIDLAEFIRFLEPKREGSKARGSAPSAPGDRSRLLQAWAKDNLAPPFARPVGVVSNRLKAAAVMVEGGGRQQQAQATKRAHSGPHGEGVPGVPDARLRGLAERLLAHGGEAQAVAAAVAGATRVGSDARESGVRQGRRSSGRHSGSPSSGMPASPREAWEPSPPPPPMRESLGQAGEISASLGYSVTASRSPPPGQQEREPGEAASPPRRANPMIMESLLHRRQPRSQSQEQPDDATPAMLRRDATAIGGTSAGTGSPWSTLRDAVLRPGGGRGASGTSGPRGEGSPWPRDSAWPLPTSPRGHHRPRRLDAAGSTSPRRRRGPALTIEIPAGTSGDEGPLAGSDSLPTASPLLPYMDTKSPRVSLPSDSLPTASPWAASPLGISPQRSPHGSGGKLARTDHDRALPRSPGSSRLVGAVLGLQRSPSVEKRARLSAMRGRLDRQEEELDGWREALRHLAGGGGGESLGGGSPSLDRKFQQPRRRGSSTQQPLLSSRSPPWRSLSPSGEAGSSAGGGREGSRGWDVVV